MVDRWRDYKMLIRRGGRMMNFGGFLWILAVIFALIGIIIEITNEMFILKSESWYSLAIIVSILSLAYWLGWAVCVYIDFNSSKNK